MFDSLYTKLLPNYFKEFDLNTNSYIIQHNMVPVSSADIEEKDGTEFVSIIDDLYVENKITGESLKFPIDIIDIPYKTLAGYKINNRHHQISDLYEMAKGWHFSEAKKPGEKGNLLSNRILKFIPDISSTRGVFYNIVLKKGIIYVEKSGKFVELSYFLKALTGDSFSTILLKLQANNRYLASTFSVPELSREECANLCFIVFNTKTTSKRSSHPDNMPQSLSSISQFIRNFTGVHASLGNGALRLTEMLQFRSNLQNCILAKSIKVGNLNLPTGTLLLPEILLELDYSVVDSISVRTQYSSKIFVFVKHVSHNFRGLNRGATDTVDDLRAAELRGDLTYTLSTGEVISRSEIPRYNSIELIYNIINLYLNFLSGFSLNSDVYSLENQTLIGVDQLIYNFIIDSLTTINLKIEDLDEDSSGLFTVKNLAKKLIPFKTSALIERIVKTTGKSVKMASLENVLGTLAQELNIVKDVSNTQRAMALVQHTQKSRLDMFDVPENDGIGATHNKTFTSRVGANSQLEAPYVRVKNGAVTGEVVYLSVADEKDKYIGEWNETFTKKTTKAWLNGKVILVDPIKIDYIEYSPYQDMSVARAMSPFPENMAGKRAQMSSNHGKQDIYVIGTERPLVNSGAESILANLENVGVKVYFTAQELIEEYAFSHLPKSEDLSACVLKYIGFVDDGPNRNFKFSFEYKGNNYIFSKNLLAFQPTLNKSIYGYTINKYIGLEFKQDDIVLHALAFDPRAYERINKIDLGHMKVDDKIFDSGISLGYNYHIGYMTYRGSTIDDAFAINDLLVTEDTASSIYIHPESCKLIKPDGKKIETFGFHDNVMVAGFNYTGIPKVGTYLEPGSPIIYKFIRRMLKDGTVDLSSDHSPTNIELPPTIGGEVISSTITGDEAVVVIACLSKTEVGDKFAGRFGNKGVVGKIVPNHLMPYNPATGKPLDVVINPLGIPSRINISQVLEVSLGMFCKQEGKIAINTPFQSNSLAEIKEMCEKAGIKPVRLIDGETGLETEGFVHIGYMYKYKLVHKVSEKIRSIGLTNEVDPTFRQPIGTGKSNAKGQAIGEMDTWAFSSAGAFDLFQEVFTLLSTDSASMDLADKMIADKPGMLKLNPSEFKNNNNDHLLSFYRASGVNIKQDPTNPGEIQIVPLSSKEVRSLNKGPEINLEYPKKSLRSTAIFGPPFNDDNRWGCLSLGGELVHPFWLKRGNIHRMFIIVDNSNNKQRHITPTEISNIISGLCSIVKLPEGWRVLHENDGVSSGMQALVSAFKTYDLNISKDFYTNAIDSAVNSGTLDKANFLHMVSSIDDVINTGGLAQYIVDCMPVLPLRYRPEPIMPGTQGDFDFFYTSIAQSASSFMVSGSIEDHKRVYEFIALFLGILGKRQSKALLRNKYGKYVDLRTFFTVKKSKGRIREKLGKKRIMRSGRSSLIPLEDSNITPRQIGLPYLMAISIFEQELCSILPKKMPFIFGGESDTIFGKNSTKADKKLSQSILKYAVTGNEKALKDITGGSSNNQCDIIKQLIREVVEPRIVVFGRQPTLHKFNFRAFYPHLVEGKALQLHPLVCKGFNADFDGDTGLVFAPMTEQASKNAWDTLSVEAGIINPGTGAIILAPTQDILLGCYYATSFKDNAELPGSVVTDDAIQKRSVEVCPYSSLDTVLSDLSLGLIKPYDWVAVKVEGRKYVSTAGRFAFNSLIPGCFTSVPYIDKYNLGILSDTFSLKYDSVVSKGISNPLYMVSISDIFMDIYQTYVIHGGNDRKTVIDLYHNISQFGFTWSERSGISFNIDDLKEPDLMADFLESADRICAEIDRQYELGLISEKGRKDAISEVYSRIKSKSFKAVFIESLGRQNNLFKMFDSRARGSEDQIIQTCGMLGVLDKTLTEPLDRPIISNYTGGLSSFDLFETSYSARNGLISTILGTSEPGELTRTLAYVFSGIKVSERHDSIDTGDLKIFYKIDSDFLLLDGKDCKHEEIIGSIILDDDALKYTVTRNYDTDGTYIESKTGNILTAEVLARILKSGLPSFYTDKGKVELDTKFPEFWEALLLNRYSKNKNYPDLVQRHYISKSTINALKKEKPSSVSAQLLLNCLSEEGISASSYGMKYDVAEGLNMGDFPGYESAQAIGEPASQLVMSLFHKAGVAGGSVESGVTLVMSMIQNANMRINSQAYCAPINGHIKLGSHCIFVINDSELVKFSLTADCKLIVQDGEYVRVGKKLTAGDIHPINSFCPKSHSLFKDDGSVVKLPDISGIYNPSAELITLVRYEIAKYYYSVYKDNGVTLLGRHFELPAFAHTSHGTVVQSSNPEYKIGHMYSIGSLYRAANVVYVMQLNNSFSAIRNNSGVLTASCYQDAYGELGSAASLRIPFKESGPLGAMFSGSDITKKGNEFILLSEDDTEIDEPIDTSNYNEPVVNMFINPSIESKTPLDEGLDDSVVDFMAAFDDFSNSPPPLNSNENNASDFSLEASDTEAFFDDFFSESSKKDSKSKSALADISKLDLFE